MISERKAGKIKIENVSKIYQTVFIYVPNKDNIPYVIGAGETLEVTTLSAGESFSYLIQGKQDKLVITLE